MTDVTGVDFVAIMTKDHDKAVEFYGETLGLPFLKQWGNMPGSEFQAGNLTLAVMQPDAFGFEWAPSSTMIARCLSVGLSGLPKTSSTVSR